MANPWDQYTQKPKVNTYYGNASDIALARSSGVQGNFIDISKYGQGSIIKDIQNAHKTGGNPMILGGAGAKGGVNDALLAQINQNGVNVGRIGGADRYEVQNNLKKYTLEQQAQPVNFDQYRTESATIDDIAKKYGFDYSRDYAKRQAEAEAQAKRNAVADAQRKNSTNKQENLKAIDNNLMNMADSLDRNYFQQYMQQAQNQTNNGLNAGIAADQDLRLAMARQAEMGGAYRDANLGRMQENNRFTNDELRLAESLGLINQEALAREDSLFNDRLQQGFENAQAYTASERDQNLAIMQAALQQRGQDIGQLESFQRLLQENQQFKDTMGWNKYQFNNLSAAQKADNQLAYKRLNEEKRQFASEQAWRKYQYENMSAAEKAQMDQQTKQFGEEMAWKYWETKYASEQALAQIQAEMGVKPQGPSENGSITPFPTP